MSATLWVIASSCISPGSVCRLVGSSSAEAPRESAKVGKSMPRPMKQWRPRVDLGLEVRVSGTTRVFISYRRQDARHVAGRLADRLVERFQVFMDMDTIEPGTDFTDVIRQAVEDCDVFLSVIGAQWMSVKDDQGQRRLDDAGDWVVAETVAALQRNVPVIPVLVDGA